ncbi:MAG: glycosyltransferase [Burkholderiaceae bacterium]|nr:glycosyltransferase [Burkholderiaceae bacterium]
MPAPSLCPAVSIITPTAEREIFLPAIARCVASQQVDWEWLVLDDSAQPSPFMQQLVARDARVRYMHHTGERLSIGAKRNRLIEAARAPVIAHFDDDDFYGASYLASMLSLMRDNGAQLIKLSGFFLYAPQTQFFGYMDLNAKVGTHYVLTGSSVQQFDFHQKMQIGADFILFYGFSYVYEKSLIALSAFNDVSLCDDESFIKPLVQAGCKIIAVDDPGCTCLHLVHPGSTSRCFSAWSIPPFLLSRLFPQYAGYPLQLRNS